MFTSPHNYNSVLYKIQDLNRQYEIIPTKDDPIYDIDLNKRAIKAPEFLSVFHDHNSETIYFKMPRYYDQVDLARADLCLIIQYENSNPDKNKRGFIYKPRYIDITTFAEENEIAFPWVIEGPATAFAGPVTFSIKIYSVNALGEYEYCLNTLPAVSKVLYGMDVEGTSENYVFSATEFEQILLEIKRVEEESDLYWIDLDESIYKEST